MTTVNVTLEVNTLYSRFQFFKTRQDLPNYKIESSEKIVFKNAKSFELGRDSGAYRSMWNKFNVKLIFTKIVYWSWKNSLFCTVKNWQNETYYVM